MTRAILLLVTSMCLLPSTAPAVGAQGTAPDCEKAAKIIEKGHPPKADYWAFAAARRCGESGARAVASGLGKYASETNVRALSDFIAQVDTWRDASVLEAATQLALNSTATPQARVFAVRHLIQLVQPNHVYTYDGLTKKADTTTTGELTIYTPACAVQITPPRSSSAVGSPLPGGYEAEIRSTLSSLANSSATPEPVRNAARCLRPPK